MFPLNQLYFYELVSPIPMGMQLVIFPVGNEERNKNWLIAGEQKNYKKEEEDLQSQLRRELVELHSRQNSFKKIHWNPEEDRLLVHLVEVEQMKWKKIPSHFHNRTQNMCYSRYRRISLTEDSKYWTREDQMMVITLIKRYGEKWKKISEKITKYTPKQIRERYLNYLRPNMSKADFTLEEDLIICKEVLKYGRHWRQIETLLPERSQGLIKNRYYSKLSLLPSMSQCLKH